MWEKRSSSVPEGFLKGPVSRNLPNFGPGHCNKFMQVDHTPTLVRFHEKKGNVRVEGRDLWRCCSNPYQFDISHVKRVDNFRKAADLEIEKEHIAEALRNTRNRYPFALGDETARTESTRTGSISARSYGSVPEREYSVRRQQSFEYTNQTPFTVHQRFPHGRGNFQAGRQNYQNTVLSVARDKPGYQGYIPASLAENVMARTWKNIVHRSAQTRSPNGCVYDGVHGYISLPDPYPQNKYPGDLSSGARVGFS